MQFLGQTGGKGWRLEKIVGKKVDVLSRGDRNHIHKGRVFLHLGLFGAVRMLLVLTEERGP